MCLLLVSWPSAYGHKCYISLSSCCVWTKTMNIKQEFQHFFTGASPWWSSASPWQISSSQGYGNGGTKYALIILMWKINAIYNQPKSFSESRLKGMPRSQQLIKCCCLVKCLKNTSNSIRCDFLFMALPMTLGLVPVATFELLGGFEPMSSVMKDATNKTIGFCSTARLSSLMALVIFTGCHQRSRLVR